MLTRTASFSRIRLAAAAALMLGLAACAQNFNANVSRFQSQLPAPSGQTFAVVADDAALAGGLEFSQYARLVEARMAQQGYTPAASPETATLLVRFDYGVDKGRERVRSTGFSTTIRSGVRGTAMAGSAIGAATAAGSTRTATGAMAGTIRGWTAAMKATPSIPAASR